MASAAPERVSMDPYFHWLGVTTPNRPPNAYELLGLTMFETSLARIQAAANRKRADLAQHREAVDPELWETVRQQLESAIDTLVDTTAKSILDASLRRAPLANRMPSDDKSALAPPSSGGDAVAAGGGLTCVECGTSNATDRRFCSRCGKSLWDQCPKCNAPHARSEQFCGQCGVNLREYVAERQAWCTSRLESARLAQGEYRFSEAAALLREVARVEDPRLDHFAREALAQLNAYQTQRKQLELSAQQALETAQQLVAAHAVERALVTLDEVPKALRTADHDRLLADVRARRGQILALSGEIRELLAQKKTLELGPRLERLLALKPDHKEAQQLAQQLAVKFIDAARKRLERRDYRGALELLRRIPSPVVSDESRQVERAAREGTWLFEQIRRSTLATRPQWELVQRTANLTPHDGETQKLRQQWHTWLRSPPREPWLAAADAHAPSATTQAGCPVDWVGRSLRLAGATVEVDQVLRENPGRWFVAMGLALQGVGEAAVDLNLKPQEKGSVWSRLSFGRRRRESTSAWGVDIGPSSIKAVLVRWDEKTRTGKVEAAELLDHDQPIDTVRDEVQLAQRLTQTLERFLAKHPVAGQKLCTNLPGIQTLPRWLLLPPIGEKKLDDLVQFEARQQIAVPLEDVVWDYACLEPPLEKKGEQRPRRVVFVAAKRHVAQARLQLWSRCDVQPDILQSDGIALHNWLRFELAGDAAEGFSDATPNAVTGLLDIGSDVTNLIFSGPQTLWFRAIGQAGDDVTRSLSRELHISRSQAEQWKREPQHVTNWMGFASAIQPCFDQLLGEWHRSTAEFTRILPEESPRRLLCLGGGAAQWGLIDALRIGAVGSLDADS